MSVNIVVYGPDNTGKSTLVSSLKDELVNESFVVETIHSPGPVGKEELLKFLDKEVMKVDSKTDFKIFDRFPIIEETVYGTVLRGHSNFDFKEYPEIMSRIDLFVYCYPGLTSILYWGDREQMDGVKENIVDIINAYNSLNYRLLDEGIQIIEYDYNRDTLGGLTEVAIGRFFAQGLESDSDNEENELDEEVVLVEEALRHYRDYLCQKIIFGDEVFDYIEVKTMIDRIDKILKGDSRP